MITIILTIYLGIIFSIYIGSAVDDFVVEKFELKHHAMVFFWPITLIVLVIVYITKLVK